MHFALRLIFTTAIDKHHLTLYQLLVWYHSDRGLCWYQWLSIIIKSFATFNDIYCQQLTRDHFKSEILPKWMAKICSILSLQCLCMISIITNCEIQLDGKNPPFTKLQISQWSTLDRRAETLQHWAQWNINSIMVKYVHRGLHSTRELHP